LGVQRNCTFRYGDTVDNEFYLSEYQTRNQLLSAINRLGYVSLGNRRDVQEALSDMRTDQFTSDRVRIPVFSDNAISHTVSTLPHNANNYTE